jgi:uncharacterized protein (DUF2062 family)
VVVAKAPAAQQQSSFWRRRVLDVIVAQLRQGITPQQIALTIALAITLGVFPVIGTTTALCAIAAFCLKLNQPIIQAVNWLASPLQLASIVLFVRIGEWLTHAPTLTLSPPELMARFRLSPWQFLQDFGATALRGILAWLLMAPALAWLLYALLLPPLRALARRSNPGQRDAR